MKTQKSDEKVLSDEVIPGSFTCINPVFRLSSSTRTLAARYLSGEFGRNMADAQFAIPPEFYLSVPSLNQQYAEAVRLIAENAPLRIMAEEKLVGAATLKEATRHAVPLFTHFSVSHTTIDFEKALKIGYNGIRAEIVERLSRNDIDSDGEDLLRAMTVCLDAAKRWHGRYVGELE
ncbi:MAG: hypothetical protein NT118_16000, partial [Lentisphaerae bacterium]|nr:hypothetical protein [Lentisphaerota bacterium]